jgi:hypothetical protein
MNWLTRTGARDPEWIGQKWGSQGRGVRHVRTSSGTEPGFTATEGVGVSPRSAPSTSVELAYPLSGERHSCARLLTRADDALTSNSGGPRDLGMLPAPSVGVARVGSRSSICSPTLDLPQRAPVAFPGRRVPAMSSADALRSGDTRCRSLTRAVRGCSAFSEVGTHPTTTASTPGTGEHTPTLTPGAPA